MIEALLLVLAILIVVSLAPVFYLVAIGILVWAATRIYQWITDERKP